jgi:general secretion pathway protein G
VLFRALQSGTRIAVIVVMFREHPARVRQRGVTLFEVLIVVAILALVAGSVGVAALSYFDRARMRMTETNAKQIRAAVKLWWTDHEAGECPTVDQLISSGTLERGSPRADPWGEVWKLECSERDVVIVSTGRDRTAGTPDDIRVPPT